MSSIRKIIVTISSLLSLASVPCLSDTFLSASCRIESTDLLAVGEVDKLTDLYHLTAPADAEGGRHLVYQTDRYELWVKTQAYRRDNDGLHITGFSTVMIDKVALSMSEASSSISETPKRATLTVHGLNDQMAIKNRMIFTCTEYNAG